ncbi:hypothetical protein QUF84_26455 [Fictibacillus enclensis]|uniref:hypothetical protein n=1 Tax=Fictibacillus enclensis TaxID=1017270 RepID=UPI0024BF1F5C|nr:hypothetical protein [Fictibacillus enclensis]MDM5340735.1 hypothetical protein [Fictibacillus enclensis]WHY72164.1 hypothetical protein QNH15_24770 [Fictibacillus enclensis]
MDEKKEGIGQPSESNREDVSPDEVYEELEFSDQAVISGIVHHLAHPSEKEEEC